MRAKIAGAWELWSILAAQAALTIPWLWRTAPFTDEALYLEAGHAEWAHWLHNAPIQNYPSWFSGAPTLYPPLAAAANSLGGLPLARTLSLVFMLGSTVLVYLVAERLFGHLTAVVTALLFALCGLDVHYGAFATYGPMAVFLLALATWAAVRISDGGPAWLAICAVALVAANGTKYATIAWDPIVVALIVLHGWPSGRWLAIGRAASMTVTTLVVGFGLLLIGGASYARGLIVTTLFRSISFANPSPASAVALHALAMTGLLVVPAALGIIVAIGVRAPVPVVLILCVLLLGSLLAPIDQARIHQLTSLDKNLGFGLPFAAIGAGYAVVAGGQWLARRRSWGGPAAVVAAVALVLTVVVVGRLQKVQFRGPGITVAREIVAAIQQHYQRGTYILSDGAARMEQYYLPAIHAGNWIATFLPDSQQKAEIARQICAGRVSIVVLRKTDGVFNHTYDATILAMLGRARRYSLAVNASAGHSSTQVYRLTTAPGTGQGGQLCG
ncbi:MAG: glycosyltransferase family 39 protein [Actinomycetota bacterium]|nr:glycosyltransferase family 39 protein [Actinomycetota bacterium]